MATETRPLRADAQLNHDRLLDAAAAAFALDGADASLKAIAKDAGVGIGTLYRRFPTRENLVEAVYRNEVGRLCDAVPDLLAASPPADALRAWMDRFVEFLATRHAMAAAFRSVLVDDGDLRMQTRGLLVDAVAELLAAGAADGSVRADLDADDVLVALAGLALVAGEPRQQAQAHRLLGLLLDGLRARPA